jgi:hypothetical protein
MHAQLLFDILIDRNEVRQEYSDRGKDDIDILLLQFAPGQSCLHVTHSISRAVKNISNLMWLELSISSQLSLDLMARFSGEVADKASIDFAHFST